jgi:membrane associated rhomboid family serine protease
VSAGGPDLFVVCKNCGSEVSPYITECPYCGNRLRKRAPKIDREGRVTEKRRRRVRRPTPSLPRLRRDEIPGIRGETRPYATIALVLVGIVGAVLWRTGLIGLQHLVVFEKPGAHSWRLLTAAFTYNNTGYAFASLGTIALYGWLLEHRHGHLTVLVVFLLGAVGGLAVTAVIYPHPLALGGNGGALALLVAWAIPDLLSLREGEQIDGDLIGTAVIAAVVLLIPLAAPLASWVAGGVGVAVGLVAGFPLARLSRA